jgi:uncharacterized protein (DUF302 family)
MPVPIVRHASAVLFAFTLTLASSAVSKAEDGIVKVKSVYPLEETIERLKRDLAAKGIAFIPEPDQSRLAANAGIRTQPSSLLVFGNPAIGTLALTSNPHAGLDWPVRLIVVEDEHGDVWAVYTNLEEVARRHGIVGHHEAFRRASQVIASIASSVTLH